MRVVMVITQFYPHVGGAERQLMLLGCELQSLGVGVRIVTARFPGLPKQEMIHGLPVVRLSSPGRHGRWSRWGNLIFLLCLVSWLINHRREYDIIHAHVVSVAACLSVATGKLLGKGTLVKVANTGLYSDFRRSFGRHGALDRLFLRGLKQVDAVVSVSSYARADLEALNFDPAQIVDIPNGVQLGPERQPGKSGLRRELGLSPGLLAVCAASLQPKKGLDVLIQAWREVVVDFPGAHLVILGEGAQRAALEALIAQSDLGDRVHLVGWVDNVTDYLQTADVFVLPSQAEGLSNALLEAMAAGLSPVATRVGGTSDVIADGENGLLVPPGDMSTLSEALLALFRDPGLRERLGHAARLTVEAGYSISSVAARYLALYRELVTL